MRGRFAVVPTAALVDVLDDLGRREQTLPPSIRPLAAGMRVAGQAFTVEGRPSEHDDWDGAIRKTLRMLGEVPPEHVAVYQCHQERSAHFGELSATSLARRGVAGCVIDGGCRDVRLIEALGLPVFTRFVTPEDWVVGDEDGVVVVPGALAAEVLVAAETKVGTENAIRDAVRDGMSPLEAYERFGTF